MTIITSKGKQTTTAVDSTGMTFMAIFVASVGDIAVPTDSKSNTGFTSIASRSNSVGQHGKWHYKRNPTVGSGHTVTISQAFSSVFVIFTDEVDVSADPFDDEDGGFNNGNVSTFAPTGAVVSVTNALVLAGIVMAADVNSPTSGYSVNSPFTLADSNAAVSGTVIGGATARQSVSSNGTYTPTFNWTGANPVAGSVIAFKLAAGGDTTAPVLTSPTGAQTGSTTGTGGATTDEANGTIYSVASTSATAPTATQVKAGQMHTGAAAAAAANAAVSTTGAKSVNFSGLTSSTTYYSHTMHEDAAGNKSNVVTSSSWTTTAGGATGMVSKVIQQQGA